MKDRTIEILIKIMNSHLPLSFDYLSEEFDVSTRTIRNEIETINEFLEENHFPVINNVRLEGLSVTFSENEESQIISLLYSSNDYYSRDERILDLILSISMSNEPTYLYKKQELYGVSKSTVDEDMRIIRNMLSEYSVEIVSIPKKGLVLQGKEKAIRTMVYSVVNKITNGLSYLNSTKSNISIVFNQYINQKDILKINQKFDRNVWNPIEDIYRQNSVLLVYIWVKRIQLGFMLSSENLENQLEKDISKNLYFYIETIKDEFQLSVNESEKIYIVFILESLISEDDYRMSDWVELQMITIQMINYVEERTGIPFGIKESTLQAGIYGHLKSMVLRLKNKIHLSNPLTTTIKKIYVEIFVSIKSFFEHFEKNVFKEITDDEIAYLTIHFSAVLSVINQENKYWFRAVVICNHGIATGKLLAENLKELFNIEILGIFSSQEIDVIKKIDVDLIFSTVDLNVDYLPFLKVDPIITENVQVMIEQFLFVNRDRRRLHSTVSDYTEMFQEIIKLFSIQENPIESACYEKLEKIFNKNKLHLNKKELQPMIEDILLDSDIQIKQNVTTWEDSIVKVSSPLLERGVIENEYVTAMIDSVKEFGPYIVLAPHFALAHARPDEGANRVGLSIMTLEKGVDFGNEDNDPVDLIFCLSAIDSHSHLKIMKEIISLINNPQKIEQLVSVTSVSELKKILLNNGGEENG